MNKLDKGFRDGNPVYLRAGETPPEGTETQTGKRGGRFFPYNSGAGHAGWEHQRRKARRLSRSVGLIDELMIILESHGLTLEEAEAQGHYRALDIIKHFSADRKLDDAALAVPMLKRLISMARHLDGHLPEPSEDAETLDKEEIPEGVDAKTGLELLWDNVEPLIYEYDKTLREPDAYALRDLLAKNKTFRADTQRVANAFGEKYDHANDMALKHVLNLLYQRWYSLYMEQQNGY